MNQTARTNLIARLLANRTVTPSGCWEWTGACTDWGYGRMSWRNHVYRVHRLAAHVWKQYGLAERTRRVLHSCDNPPCFNPEHLFFGTLSDNTRDMVAKGRNYIPQPRAVCSRGHAKTGHNAIKKRQGIRCRTCDNAQQRARRAQKHADLLAVVAAARAYLGGTA